jgi:hypothetical protein
LHSIIDLKQMSLSIHTVGNMIIGRADEKSGPVGSLLSSDTKV